MAEDDHDEFWGPIEQRPGRRSGGRHTARSSPSTQNRTVPIVVGAAALLLIVVVFLVARANHESSNQKTAGSSDVSPGSTGQSATNGPTSSAPNSSTISATSPNAPAPPAEWQLGVVGAPKAFSDKGFASPGVMSGSTATPGVYLWESYDGWHVRVVRGNGTGAVSGSVTGDRGTPFGLKVIGADPSAARIEGSGVRFDLPARGPAVVGVDFTLDFYASRAAVTMKGPGGNIPAGELFLGPDPKTAPSNPITFEKK